MKISNETKVGLLAATAIVMLIFGYSYLKGKKLFGTENTYYAVFNKVDGLLAANPVLVHGLQVGLVEGIKLKEDEMDKVVVQFVVEDYIKVPKNASIQIVSTGLLGDKAMELSLPAPKDGYAESGGYIEGVDEKSLTDLALETVMPLKDKAESLADSLDAALFKINKLLRSDEMQTTMENVSLSVANVQGTLANVESIVENINEFTENDLQRVGTIMANIEAISESLEQDMVQVRSILNNTQVASKKIADLNVEPMMQKLDATIAEAQKSLSEVTAIASKIQDGEGTMGLLMNDEKLYDNLERVTRDLDLLLVELKANPKKFIPPLVQIGGKKKNNKNNETPKNDETYND